MRDNYVKLIDFVFGKYTYTVMKNNDKVMYFEVVNNKYVLPVDSFNLYDNEGKSLTSVNEHFFMNQLVNRINNFCRKGILISDQEIVEYLEKIKSSSGDPELKKLFKGSNMKQIDEFNFEDNKRNLIRYLDKFKYDSFVDYNNVSIFDGSLEKNGSLNNEVESNESLLSQSLDDKTVVSDESLSALEPVVSGEPLEELTDSEVINNELASQSGENKALGESTDVDTEVVDVSDISSAGDSNALYFENIPVNNSLGNVVSSSEYFSNKDNEGTSQNVISDVSQSSVSENNKTVNTSGVGSSLDAPIDFQSLFQSNISDTAESVDVIDDSDLSQSNVSSSISQTNVMPTESVSDVNISQPINNFESSVELNPLSQSDVSIEPVSQSDSLQIDQTLQSNVSGGAENAGGVDTTVDFNSLYQNTTVSQPVQQDMVIQPIYNQNLDNGLNQNSESFSNDGFSMSEPLIENSTVSNMNNDNIKYSEQISFPSINNGLGVMNSNITESDLEKTVVTDKVNMPTLDSVSSEKPKKVKEKKSIGVVLFIIVLLLVLAGFAYFLYNYIF